MALAVLLGGAGPVAISATRCRVVAQSDRGRRGLLDEHNRHAVRALEWEDGS